MHDGPDTTIEDEPSDAALLSATSAGDRDAFEAFVERHAPALWRFLVLAMRTNEDAEDVMQQTFLAAWKGASGARVERGARPWLFTIARHAAERVGRRTVRRADQEASLEALGEAAGFASEQATPEAFAEALEAQDLLEAALGDLASDDRAVLVLRDVEGLDGRATAEALGLTLAAMKSRLHRARLHLAVAVRRRAPSLASDPAKEANTERSS